MPCLHLPVQQPFAWAHLLAFLAARAIPGVESIAGDVYRRTIVSGGRPGVLEVGFDSVSGRLNLHLPPVAVIDDAVERIRRMFDLGAGTAAIGGHLSRDPLLRKRVARAPGLRIPGCWDGFELAVRAVLGQQVTVKGASTLAGRLVREYGTAFGEAGPLTRVFPSPAVLADADFAKVGLPAARVRTLQALAAAVRDGHISLDPAIGISKFRARFCELPGIGEWTAQYVALRALGDRDAFPSADLGLLRAAGIARAKDLEQRSQSWRPWRAYAALYLWQIA